MYLVYLIVILFSLFYVNHTFSKGSNRFLILIWFFLLVIMGTYGYFSDDFEAYEDIVMDAYANPFGNIHMEGIWVTLAQYCKGDVIAFRFISFICLAFVLTFVCFQFKTEFKYFICYYSLICLSSHICWIRQPLAMGVFLLGLGMLLNKKILFGLTILLLSIFLHKMAFVFIGMLAFLIIPINRTTIWMYICFALGVFGCFTALLSINFPYSAFLILYLESEGEFETRNIIFTILSNMMFILSILILIGSIYKFHKDKCPELNYLTRYLLGILMLALGLWAVPYETGVLVKRVLALGSMVNVIILAKGVKANLYKKRYRCISFPLLINCLLGNTYTLGNNYTRLYRLLRLR